MKIRNAEGGAYESRGKFYIRVTLAPQYRPAKLVPWATSLPEAIQRAQVVQALVQRLRTAGEDDVEFLENLLNRSAVADAEKLAAIGRQVDALLVGKTERMPVAKKGGPLTFRKFAEQWTDGEIHKLYPDHVNEKRSKGDDAGRLGKWVYPVVKDLPLASFTIEHAQAVLRAIPRDKSAATRRHVAQLLVRVLNLAVYPCRHIAASPLPRGFLPKLGPRKAYAYLFPNEDAQLVSCDAVDEAGGAKVPLVHRMIYGVAAREGLRSDEAQTLQWGDLDLERGTLRLDENKTDAPRTWALDEGVASALDAWSKMVPSKTGDPVFPGLTKPYALAQMLRDHLQAAGVDRAELFETSKARRQMRAHDLRATFITLSLASGRTESWVADRTGHTTSQQINGYRRAARTVEELGLGWLEPLDEVVPEIAAAIAAAERGGRSKSRDARAAAKLASSLRFRRKDSNLRKRNQNPLSCH